MRLFPVTVLDNETITIINLYCSRLKVAGRSVADPICLLLSLIKLIQRCQLRVEALHIVLRYAVKSARYVFCFQCKHSSSELYVQYFAVIVLRNFISQYLAAICSLA